MTPCAMLPLCGYNMGDYFAHWLYRPFGVRRQTAAHLLRRLVPQGRVRQVLVAGLRREQPRPELDHRRLSSDAQAAASRIGRIPARDPLGTDGLDIDQDDLNLLLSVDTETWKQEATPISEHLRTFSGHTCPARSGTSTTICAADLAEPQTMSSFRRPLKRLGVARLDTHPGGGRHASPRIVAPGFPRWYSTKRRGRRFCRIPLGFSPYIRELSGFRPDVPVCRRKEGGYYSSACYTG